MWHLPESGRPQEPDGWPEMNGYSDRASRPGAIRRHCGPIALGLLLASLAAEAQASPIRSRQASATLAARKQAPAQAQNERRAVVNAMMETRWQDYFARALRQQRTDVQRPPNLFGMLSATEDGLLPDTPIVEYLRWRRSRAPRRFDLNHPGLAPILWNDEAARLARRPPALAALPALPGEPNLSPTLSIAQVPIPEPSTLVIALAIVSSMAWRQRLRLRSVRA
ncbi:hypothetical protein BH23PLA1_BH23PLA1_34760 [soil metagenome]